ncbi:phage tail protein [Streptomyces sp. NPDC088812]|uniref:phage tail protein n=1 Tax=Streptomyces sp. NPDC088812 TaxID=3365905 RepID=UPI00381B5693
MGNDIEIRVRVANQTASGLTAVNNSLRRLRDEARDSGQSLTALTARATAATLALRGLKDAAQDAARALRSLNTAARNADGRLDTMSNRARTLRRDTDDLDDSMRRLTTTMGGLGGRVGTIRMDGASNGMNGLRKAALMLSPALVPIAASAVPIAASLTAAGVAVGVFGLAIAGQVSAVNDASDAQKKYDDAVKKHGPASKEAAQAERLYLDQVKDMAPATRQAASALTVLKDQYQAWSKSLAGDTMPVFTKGLATAGALLPKLTPAVKGASAELDRFMTILAGGVNSGGFSQFMESFSSFATGALSRANDALVRFMRTMSEGAGSSQFTEFLAYVRDVGPQVGETLSNLGRALTHLVASTSEVGVSILTVVNGFAKLVNAIPTEVLGNLLQFVVVFKAVKLAAMGLGGAGGALASFGTSLAAMSAASTAAGGGLSGLAAAFGTLSRAAKVALISSGIGILVVALSSLSEMGKKAPPDIDKMTTSLRSFAQTGKATGEAARVFGDDLSGLADSLQKVTDPKGLDQVQQSIMSFFGTDSTPVKDAKENLDGLDQALANLVKNGQADLAAAALENISTSLKKQGFTSKEVSSQLDDYKAALADQAFEQQLAAQSMGLFGEQALAVQSKLDAQKQSADGLRQSIQALNDVNRQGLGGMIGFEAAIDAAAKAASENAGALSMTGGQLNLNSEKARNAASALNDLAAKTEEAAASARESGSSWETVNGIYTRGRTKLIETAQAMGLNKEQATQLAESILNIPDEKTTQLNMIREDAQRGIEAFNAAIKATPGAKSVTLKTLSGAAEKVLEAFGYKVTHLKDGSVTVTAATGGALSGIQNVSGAIASLNGDVANTYVNVHYSYSGAKRSDGATFMGASGRLATGGPVPRYASGGDVQAFPTGGYVQGPGSGTSDSILAFMASGAMARISNTEYVVRAAAVQKYGVRFLDALNSGRLKVAGYAKGGLTKSQLKGLSQPGDVAELTSTVSEVRARIKSQTSGDAEKRLLRTLDSVAKKLTAHEKSLISVNKALESAKDRLNDLKTAASQLKDSVKNNILSAAGITRGATSDGPVTVSSIMGSLTANRDKATAFASALKGLQSKGLRADLIQQIAEAGIDGGGLNTAGALLSASSSEITSVNALQSQIASAAKAAGQTTADSVYAVAIKNQTATVSKLQKSQDKLEKAMSDLTKALNRSVVKAVGKKAAGGIVGAAASGGIRGGLTWVGEHEPELLDLPVGSRVWSGPDSRRKLAQAAPWASMLTAPRGAPAPAAAATDAGGDSTPIVIQVKIADREFGELWLDTGRKQVRAIGSIDATLKPTRGR